jgi:hypothetical protein
VVSPPVAAPVPGLAELPLVDPVAELPVSPVEADAVLVADTIVRPKV